MPIRIGIGYSQEEQRERREGLTAKRWGGFSVGDGAPEGQRQRWDRWVGAAGSSRPRGVRSEAAVSIDLSRKPFFLP
ncbi:hypothetical protein BHE74_00040081 [Ensete ventricosum]|uniref:Uncharacterized protein n=1 Tax=Ensete ventricosum TaxID=4639 RepID=A0A426XRE7_ENSVE|nr:hypothetical protein B296_00054923 [Ensete ventricosum]RWW53428.1 hypothetical protein BHE74_00040081 [Ensete ventricosum]